MHLRGSRLDQAVRQRPWLGRGWRRRGVRFCKVLTLGRLAASVRLAAPVQAKDEPAASAELDRTVRQVFGLANQYMRGSSMTWPDA